jgi:hypothetical protein
MSWSKSIPEPPFQPHSFLQIKHFARHTSMGLAKRPPCLVRTVHRLEHMTVGDGGSGSPRIDRDLHPYNSGAIRTTNAK